MADNDHGHWRDDGDRQERERIARVRHAYGPEDHRSAGKGSGRYSSGDAESSRDDHGGQRRRDTGYRGSQDWRHDDIGAEASGQSFVGNEGRGYGYGSDYRSEYRGGDFGGGDDYGYRNNVRRSSRGNEAFEQAPSREASRFGGREADSRDEANHRGRGPKGYRRSDERIKEDVCDRLAGDRYVDASDIEVAVQGGEVTLSGSVDDRQARRRAEDLAQQVSGVSYVQISLRVKGRPGSGYDATSSAGASSEAQGHLAGSGQVPGPSVEASENRSTNSQLPL
jgi:osmotically-inducible protein OsmY